MTRFGSIAIAKQHPYSQGVNGFWVSPFLQDQCLFLAQQLPYSLAHQTAQRLLGPSLSRTTLYRLTTHYGQSIEAPLNGPPTPPPPAHQAVVTPDTPGDKPVVYALADGLMLLFEEGYKETKLGRIFSADALQKSSHSQRGGSIVGSDYVAHVGCWADFWTKWQGHLQALEAQGHELVFISDGVVWLHEQLVKAYPHSTLILDFYHAMEHLGGLAQVGIGAAAKRALWLEDQRKSLLESNLDEVLAQLDTLSVPPAERLNVRGYLEANRSRMDYKAYRARGLCIGSGAIESANQAVVQVRLKRSGQRWSRRGAQRVLNLRTCWMSERWSLVEDQLRVRRQARVE